jgi:hypothetical protein
MSNTSTILKFNDIEYYFRWEYYDYEQKVYPKTDLLPNQICIYKDGKRVIGEHRHHIPNKLSLGECVEILKGLELEN